MRAQLVALDERMESVVAALAAAVPEPAAHALVRVEVVAIAALVQTVDVAQLVRADVQRQQAGGVRTWRDVMLQSILQ